MPSSVECIRAWRARNPEKVKGYAEKHREYHRACNRRNNRKRHGLTRGEYGSVLAEPCGICGDKATDLDHDHTTGRVRGGPCRHYNRGLGAFKDNPTPLAKAVKYLGK